MTAIVAGWRPGWLALICAALFSTAAGATVSIQVSGDVAHPGRQQLPDGARLADALNAAQVSPQAYVLGAAWLRPRLLEEQVRLKAGVLYELGLLEAKARLDGDASLAQLAASLLSRLQAMPATGRQTDSLLDQRPVAVSTVNHYLADGDRLVFPSRPASVRVVGAVRQVCVLPQVAMRAARDYSRDCAHTTDADPGWLYIIQPDGTVKRQGVALWNLDPPQPLAPGAVLYVPIRESVLPDIARGSMNDEIARFIATQVLPEKAP